MKMKKQKKQVSLVKRILVIVLIAVMIGNLILLAGGKIDPLLFWIIIAVCAIITFTITKKKK